MSIKAKTVLAAAFVFGAVVAASAATTKQKIAIRQIGLSAHHTVPSSLTDPDSDDPVAAGGGSLGYNQALHYWW